MGLFWLLWDQRQERSLHPGSTSGFWMQWIWRVGLGGEVEGPQLPCRVPVHNVVCSQARELSRLMSMVVRHGWEGEVRSAQDKTSLRLEWGVDGGGWEPAQQRLHTQHTRATELLWR